ncbi:MAG: flagellar hook-basal body complex protein [Helicobacteraceae bacterium]|jgi:flagellar hook protein FlgE|nr:flagellar hook-basal body complex protein [Helicobacteraceae bacterium]
MMRSLFSGVSGLVSHQVAMDVEGNNIANVNTYGFKYSRTNFQDTLLQTLKPSTAPQGQLGGRNALQIGSGVGVANVQRIHLQGPTQATDKNTDMAIKGDGFFVVSADGGRTYSYTRAGNFAFDANGNFVNPNGLIVQGWIADERFNVDSSMGIENILIDPAMTVPAKPSANIKICANLNAGSTLGTSERSPSSSTINLSDDVGSLYSFDGKPLGLKRNNDILTLELTRTFDAGGTLTQSSATYTFTYGVGSTKTDGYFITVQDLLDEINSRIKDSTGVYDNKVLLTGDGQIAAAQHITAVYESMSSSSLLCELLEPVTYGTFMSKTFKTNVNAFIGADDLGEMFNDEGKAFLLKAGEGLAMEVGNLGEIRKFVYRDPSQENFNDYINNNFQSTLDITKADNSQGLHWTLNSSGEQAFLNVGDTITFTFNPVAAGSVIAPLTLTYGQTGVNTFQTIEQLIEQVNTTIETRGGTSRIVWDADNGLISDGFGVIGSATVGLAGGGAPAAGTPQGRLQDIFTPLGGADGVATASGQFRKNDVYYFTNIQELVNLYQDALDDAGDPLNFIIPINSTVIVNDYGQIEIKNNRGDTFDLNVTGYNASPRLGEEQIGMNAGNTLLTKAMAMGAPISPGSNSMSGTLNAATFRVGVEVYDSSGAKHQLTFNFRKTSTSYNNNDPTVWRWYVDAAEPTTFEFPTFGEIRFNLDGSVQSSSPPSIVFNPNTGSASGQILRLDFGLGGSFSGLTSFAETSAVRNNTGADGYAGGFLQETSIDLTGMIIGEFSNGKQFNLGQVAIATFVNNEGLKALGGNLFSEAPNSGDATIGMAGTASRGEIAPSTLEMSNVDLSKALTNLIIIQRGYQASSKTITTSDQLLNTLLQLKQ